MATDDLGPLTFYDLMSAQPDFKSLFTDCLHGRFAIAALAFLVCYNTWWFKFARFVDERRQSIFPLCDPAHGNQPLLITDASG